LKIDKVKECFKRQRERVPYEVPTELKPWQEWCEYCGGDGQVRVYHGDCDVDRCHVCRGRGWVPVND
jgi:DnaJ-class molecular chaperone